MTKLRSFAVPKKSTVVPSTGETVTYREFLVKEERGLLMLNDPSASDVDRLRAMVDIVDACVDVDVKRLSADDVKYLFVKLRSFSVGNISSLSAPCPNDKCTHEGDVRFEVDLDTIVFENNEDLPEDIIKVRDEGDGLHMTRPGLIEVINKMEQEEATTDVDNTSAPENKTAYLKAYIKEIIYADGEIVPTEELSDEEFGDFVNSLPFETSNKISAYIEATPTKTYIDTDVKCPICETQIINRIEGVGNFI